MTIELRVEGYPTAQVRADQTLLEACESIDVPMESACGGFACCNSCRVDVLQGAEVLSERREEEEAFLDTDRQRLGCQAHLKDMGGSILSVRLSPGS